MGEKLLGKKALVTGASRGIGRGIALAYAAEGADVAVGYRREAAAADAVVKEIQSLGRQSLALAADVREPAAVEAMMQQANEAFDGLDIVVANAGVPTRFQRLHEVEPSYWQRVIEIDLTGVFHTLHAAIPVLKRRGSGVLLTVSSVAADLCAAGGGPYVAAKAAVNALTRVVARETAAEGIRANVIAPGLIATEMGRGVVDRHGEQIVNAIPLGRLGTVEEVAALAVYLASDEATWVTGKVFRIDGGAF